tara:strand:+ start:209 stop:517 length:309 start_codon:yes stop_codon:yes gene_type:complete
MKYYVNKKTMMIGVDDKTYWLNPSTSPDWLPVSFEPRLKSCLINDFRSDLHTIEYDDQTDTCLEIDTNGENFVSSLKENSGVQEIIDIFKELEAAEEEHTDD